MDCCGECVSEAGATVYWCDGGNGRPLELAEMFGLGSERWYVLSTLGPRPGRGLEGRPYARPFSPGVTRPFGDEPSECKDDCDNSGATGKGRKPPFVLGPRRTPSGEFIDDMYDSDSFGRCEREGEGVLGIP